MIITNIKLSKEDHNSFEVNLFEKNIIFIIILYMELIYLYGIMFATIGMVISITLSSMGARNSKISNLALKATKSILIIPLFLAITTTIAYMTI